MGRAAAARTALLAILCAAGPAAADPDADYQKANKAWTDAKLAGDRTKKYAASKQRYAARVKLSGEGSPQAEYDKYLLAEDALDAGDLAFAEKLLNQIVAAKSKTTPTQTADVSLPLGSLIRIYEVRGRYDEAEAAWQKILAASKQLDGESSAAYAQQWTQYSRFLWLHDDNGAAVRAMEKALAIREKNAKSPTDPDLFSALSEVAQLYLKTNQEKKAIAAYDRALKINETSTSGIALGRITFMWGVGQQYFFAGRKDLADKVFVRAIDRAEKDIANLEKTAPDDRWLGDLYSELALLYQYRKDTAKAAKAYGRALAIAKKRKSPGAAAGALVEVLRAQGKTKDALAVLQLARAELAAVHNTSPSFYDVVAADVSSELGDPKTALKLIAGYLAAVNETFGWRSAMYVRGALELTDIQAVAGDIPKAEKALADTLETAEKSFSLALGTGTDADHVAYAAQNAMVLDTALSFNVLFAAKRPSAARLGLTTLLRRKGRVLDASAAALATIRNKLSPDDKKLLDELAAARTQLAKLSVGATDATRAKEIAALEETIQRLEVELGKKSAAYRKATAPIGIAAIQKILPKDARLVEFANYEPRDPRRPFAAFRAQGHLPRRYLAYVLGPTGDPQLVDLGEAAAIDAAIEKARKAYADPDNSEAANLGKALYDLTMGKVVPKLGGATNILLAPDGALNVIPFSALVDDKKQFLIAKYTFTYLTSGRDLLRLQVNTKAQGGGVMFADPAFDATGGGGTGSSRGQRSLDLAALRWPQLPGTAAEADAVAKTYKGLKVLRGNAATEGAVKKIHGPKILHLATHGFFLPDEQPEPMPGQETAPTPTENPMLRSGLVFSGANKLRSGDDDGLLTALEASGLDLEGTKLVVLSACETGVGKVTNGDGVYGLRRALVIAGAESLVMSLWQVDDFATKELMTGFYKGIADGKARSTALRETQLKLLSTPKYAHPFYWAAFVPAGATTPIKD